MTEEALVHLFERTDKDTLVKLSIRKAFGNVSIDLTAKGQEFDFINTELLNEAFGMSLAEEDLGERTEDSIRQLVLKSFADKLKYRHSKGVNHVRIEAVRSQYALLYMTLAGLFGGLIFGLILKFLPGGMADNINKNVFSLVTTVFMNGLQTVVTPVVFFSIATSIAGFGDISEIGKIGGKVMISYILTSVVAILLGIGLFFVFHPGDPSIAQGITGTDMVVSAEDIAAMQSVSIRDTLLNLVPSNIVKPFLESNMLQVIVIAIFCGIGTGMIGRFSTIIKDMFEALNELFQKITVILVQLIPIVTFCSMASMMIAVGGDAVVSVLGIAGLVLLGLFAMMIVYSVLIVIFTGANPIRFYKEYGPTMLQVFSLSSSNAAIPLNMKACGEKLGISPKVYSFSIPLGATINMNGACIMLSVFALSLARIYGVTISGSMLVMMCVTIILLSMGAPGIPGMGIILLAVILTQFGIPIVGVSLVMGINSLLDMSVTAVNCLGDVVTTFIVAKSEGLMDAKVFGKS